MNFLTYTVIATLLVSFYFRESFFDIYENFGVYFPFFNISVYVNLFKHVLVPRFHSKSSENSVEKLFTKEDLSQMNGQNSENLYLSILGKVFDVSTAPSHYAAGQTYNVLTGRDASKAFITGDFSESGLTDDVLDLPLHDLRHLKEWLRIYDDKYTFKGKLIGRYYDRNGNPTDYNLQVMKRLLKAEKDEDSAAQKKEKFPPCNVEWSAEKGSRVWCSMRSGGVERDWVGVPRKLYTPATNSYRCACINSISSKNTLPSQDMSKYISEYENCEANAYSCFIKT